MALNEIILRISIFVNKNIFWPIENAHNHEGKKILFIPAIG